MSAGCSSSWRSQSSAVSSGWSSSRTLRRCGRGCGGPSRGAWIEGGGLSSDGDAVEYRNGDDVRLSVRKLPGLRKFANITLKRGYTTNDELWKWRANIVTGKSDRRHGAIILMDEERKDVLAWEFE